MASAPHPALEMGIYAVGRLELASNFQEVEDPQARAALIEAKIFLTYQRQLNNLSIQEGRLRRQREKDLAALQQLQFHRRQQHEKHLREAVQLYKQSQEEGWTFNPSDIGFEITLAQIEDRIAEENFRARGYSPSLSARLLRGRKGWSIRTENSPD
jgi:FKBP-type peptidyl-prolyl cis-trans isomerase (trigger factor)